MIESWALKTLAQRGDVFRVMSRGKIVLSRTAADAKDDEIRRC